MVIYICFETFVLIWVSLLARRRGVKMC